ncbi:unnamed protein product [Allacma fusca]|uniref:Uncharacterized protein n=1 Tax=Allacma fusca TaxID=39272 RepID=A0A8J2KIA5_9HEXA|nr:unnamed protein product [Allacma fusca]
MLSLFLEDRVILGRQRICRNFKSGSSWREIEMTTQRSGVGIGVSLDKLTQRLGGSQFRQDATSLMNEIASSEKSYEVNFDEDISTLEQTNRFSRKRKFDMSLSSEDMSELTRNPTFGIDMTLDEVARLSRAKLDINMSLDEISRMSRASKHDVGISLDEIVASGSHEVDCTSLSLAEVIQRRKIEGPRKRRDSDRCKKSKWDRYNKSDTEEEEEEEVEDTTFIPGHLSSDSSDEEPISLPMHAGHDDEDRKEIVSDDAFCNESEGWF